jgi:glycerol-3-phosphate dehydrogenase
MIAMNHRLVNTCINRCQMPTDGDIIVPIRTVSVIGTTDQGTDDPDDHTVHQSEVDAMLADGEQLIPGFKQARALRVWTGVRPLFEDRKTGGDSGDTRDVTRAHAMLDHRERDGVGGFLTITGGKLTTYRLMAKDTVDAVCRHLGVDRPCTTATESLPGSEDGDEIHVGDRLGMRERHLLQDQLVCECELISRGRLEEVIRRRSTTSLDDIRRQLRLGMGPCQGGFCIYRATGILHSHDGIETEQANQALRDYVAERWKGVWPILYGDQLRQARFDDWVFQGVLDVGRLT